MKRTAPDPVPGSAPAPAATPAAAAATAPESAGSGAARVWDSAVLFQGEQLVWIRHRGETYQLRTTRQGKLILTK
jgi:hemin uptake protein HemP